MGKSEIKKEIGVNFDYILALDTNDNGSNLSLEKIEISRQDSLIDEMLEMFDNPNYDAADMSRHARNAIWSTDNTFRYCFGYSYYAAYIDDIMFPELDADYHKVVSEKITHISNCYMNGYIDYANKLKGQLNVFIKKAKEEYLKRILQ